MAQVGNIGTRPTKVGDLISYELEPATGYCRENVSVTVPAGGLSVGAVLENTTSTTNYALIAQATTANASAILVDESVYGLAAGNHMLAVLTRGPAQVADDSLSYNADINTAAEILAVSTRLATLGIRTVVQL